MDFYDSIMAKAPDNINIRMTLSTLLRKFMEFYNPLCSVSGGSDSDIMIDLIERLRENKPIKYVFFDTGIEYQATHEHLTFLEEKYGIKIERLKPKASAPIGCKKYGQPFLSKQISEFIERLQRHNFQWEDKPFNELYKQYPKCKAALRWWCNEFGNKSSFNINKNRLLKEFIICNPPRFSISPKCCDYGKKKPAKLIDKIHRPDLKIIGIRRAESGVRSTIYHNCFSLPTANDPAEYRPLFFWSDKDKAEYKAHYGINYSDCYEIYGLTRTGCAGCPFGSGFENELKIIHNHEPKLEQAINTIFADSYAYTRSYREFKKVKT